MNHPLKGRSCRGLLTLGAGAALLAGTMAMAVGAVAPATGGAATAATGTEVLSMDLLPGLPLLTPAAVDPSTELHIGVALSEPNASAENAYEQAIYSPSSPEYHQFLTPSAFASEFGVAPATYRAVQQWLIGGGLTVTETAGAGNWIQATGTVAQIQSLMNVTIGSYTSKGVTFLANEQAPTVPSGDSIQTVVGLNTLQHFSIPQTIVGQPNPPTSAGCLPSCDYTPQDLWSLYGQPSTDKGQGVTMGIFGEGRSDDVISNLRAFEKTMKLRQIPITVDDVGAGPFTDDSGQIEWDLDTQASTGMAPDAYGEKLYFGSSLTDADVETMFSAWVSDPSGPPEANASFGECETDPGNEVWQAAPPAVGQFVGDGDNLEPVAEATLEQATIEGRTLFAAAGDTGSSCPLAALPVIGAGNGLVNQGQPMLNYPCASDYAVCVGGTVLYSNGAATSPKRQLEYAWPYTGGGSALFQAEPSFQDSVSTIDHPCVVDPSGSPYPQGTICRGAPDVAAMSGDVATNAYDFFYNGTESTEGGTSLSSPLWVGMWTRVQAAAPAGGLGFADPTFYAIGAGKLGKYARDFYDITVGTNGLYQAGTGWDYVSGWGVPEVTNLTRDLDHTLTPTNNVLPPPPGSGPKPPVRDRVGEPLPHRYGRPRQQRPAAQPGEGFPVSAEDVVGDRPGGQAHRRQPLGDRADRRLGRRLVHDMDLRRHGLLRPGPVVRRTGFGADLRRRDDRRHRQRAPVRDSPHGHRQVRQRGQRRDHDRRPPRQHRQPAGRRRPRRPGGGHVYRRRDPAEPVRGVGRSARVGGQRRSHEELHGRFDLHQVT